MRSDRERELARLEQSQFGACSSSQLRRIGISKSAIQRHVARGASVRISRGVIASPSVLVSFEQRVMAAVLAAGDDAIASHESAARLWGLPFPGGAAIEVTTVLERRVRLPGVRSHRTSILLPEDRSVTRGIPVTSVARTIVDLSGRLDLRSLGRIVDAALRRRLISVSDLVVEVERFRSAPGRSRKKLNTVMIRRDRDTARRETPLEDFVFDAIERFRLPAPVPQFPIMLAGRPRRIDLCYPSERLALEPMGFDAHSKRQQFDEDALRGNELQLAGFRVLEFTSAFTDWQIACHVAAALELPTPRKPRSVLTYTRWADRLGKKAS